MDSYKKTESMLYNYKKTKIEIENIKIDLDILKGEYGGITSIGYEEKTGKTNKFNSSVENEILNREREITRLQNKIKKKEAEVRKIENAISNLEERERKLIELKYFKKKSNIFISIDLSISEIWVCKLKTKAVNNISELLCS